MLDVCVFIHTIHLHTGANIVFDFLSFSHWTHIADWVHLGFTCVYCSLASMSWFFLFFPLLHNSHSSLSLSVFIYFHCICVCVFRCLTQNGLSDMTMNHDTLYDVVRCSLLLGVVVVVTFRFRIVSRNQLKTLNIRS